MPSSASGWRSRRSRRASAGAVPRGHGAATSAAARPDTGVQPVSVLVCRKRPARARPEANARAGGRFRPEVASRACGCLPVPRDARGPEATHARGRVQPSSSVRRASRRDARMTPLPHLPRGIRIRPPAQSRRLTRASRAPTRSPTAPATGRRRGQLSTPSRSGCDRTRARAGRPACTGSACRGRR